MRILKSFFYSLIGLAILGSIAFLVLREVLLITASVQIQNSIRELKRVSLDQNYRQECQQQLASLIGDPLDRVQLRFTSDTKYQVEVICRQLQLKPIVVSTHQLPLFVNKVAGSSGIMYVQNAHGLVLEIFGRSQGVAIEEFEAVLRTPTQVTSGGPQTACQGYGYTCCPVESAVGIGQPITEALDCPLSCYAQCEARPLVLSFSSEPPVNLETRTVTIQSGTEVSFYYVIESSQGGTPSGTINFGDGNMQDLTDTAGQVLHRYTCASTCEYSAVIEVIDTTTGIKSAISPASQIKITVTR